MAQFAFTFPTDSGGRGGAVVPTTEGNAFAVPMLDIIGAHTVLTTGVALGVSATYTSPTRDRLAGGLFEARVRFFIDTNQASAASGVIVEESHDQTTWATVGTAGVTVANTLYDSGWRTLTRRYWRFRYVNGTTANTRFDVAELRDSLIDDALVSGTVSVNALPVGANLIGSVTPLSSANFIGAPDSTTNLGAAATYTGTNRDLNTYGALRVLVAHTAGNTPGHLVFQQSTDNTTFRETHRLPIPSDGLFRTFDFAMVQRYGRVLFVNGATAQTAFYLASRAVTVEDGVPDPTVMPFLDSTTALALSATFNGPTLDMGPKAHYNIHRATVFADQPGTLQLQQSRDGTTWRAATSVSVAANVLGVSEAPIHTRFLRTVFINGATANTVFEQTTSLR